jgi:hypothetical protein
MIAAPYRCSACGKLFVPTTRQRIRGCSPQCRRAVARRANGKRHQTRVEGRRATLRAEAVSEDLRAEGFWTWLRQAAAEAARPMLTG